MLWDPFKYEGETYKEEAMPISQTCIDGVCSELDITINDESIGIIKKMRNGWKIDRAEDQKFVDVIGEEIEDWFK